MNNNKILYTGSNGSIGSYFNKEAIPFETRLECSEEEIFQDFQKLNCKDFKLVHLAGITSPRYCEENKELAYDINVNGAVKLFNAAARSGCKEFIFISTSHVYKLSNNKDVYSTDCPTGPISYYGFTKLEAEKKLQQEFHNLEPKCNLKIARVFSVLSNKLRPGFLLTSLVERIRTKNFTPIPNINNTRDFLWAEEVCEQILKLAKDSNAPQIINICSGKGSTIKEIAEEVFLEHGENISNIIEGPVTDPNIKTIIGKPYFI